MSLLHWPPDQTLASIASNPDYALAAYYFLLDAGLTGLALLLGWGFQRVLVAMSGSTGRGIPPAAHIFLALACGFALIIAQLFVLAVFHLLTPRVTMIVLLASAGVAGIAGLALHGRVRGMVLPATPWPARVIPGLLVLVLALLQFASVGVPAMCDATSYHVPYADVFLQHRGLAVDEHLIYPYNAFNINLLYSLALMLDRDLSYVQSVHALLATLSLFGMFAFCRSAGQRWWVSLATPFLCVQVYTVWYARYLANVDLGGMFFVLAAVFAAYLWGRDRDASWLLAVSAIAFGMAIGSKYILCVFALPFALHILWQAKGRCLRPWLVYAAWASAFGLWWYIRNWLATGNPLHPFAPGLFGYYLLDASDMTAHVGDMQNTFIPRNLMGLLQMPWFAHENEVLNAQGAFLVIVLLYAGTLLQGFAMRGINMLLLFAWVQLLSWWLASQDPRHLMSVMPLVFIQTASVVDGLLDGCGRLWARMRGPVVLRHLGTLGSVVAVSGVLGYGAVMAWEEFVKVFYIQLSPGDGQETMQRGNPMYDLFYVANREFSDRDTVYEFAMRDGRWLFKGHLVGTQFGPHGYWHVIQKAAKPDTEGISAQRLEEVLRRDYGAVGFLIPLEGFPYDIAEFDARFRLVYRNAIGSIYRFRGPGE